MSSLLNTVISILHLLSHTPPRVLRKEVTLLSLCLLCQQCFYLILNLLILLEEDKQHLCFLNIYFPHPLTFFVRKKVQVCNCDVKHFVLFFLFYPLEHLEESFMPHPVIIISARGQGEYFNVSKLTGQGHLTVNVMADR